jgi:phospholipid/cholesterol/gamma-HCH transport system substrate-binding protein
VSYSDRYVELIPGSPSAPKLADGARLPTTDTVTPVEFDQLFNVFNTAGRTALGRIVDTGASTLGRRAPALSRDLRVAAPALDQIAGVLRQLGEDPTALETLVASGAHTAGTLRDHQAQLVDLVGSAADTFSTVAQNAQGTELTLAKLPGALDAARSTLTNLDPTLHSLDGLVGDLTPGAIRLRSLSAPLDAAVHTLGRVAPQLDGTLAVVQRRGPAVTRLLHTARPVLDDLRPALTQLGPIAACVRPYVPELAGWFSTWASMGSYYDAGGHYGRVLAQAFPFPDDSSSRPSTVTSAFRDLGYALIRPPGYSAGSTWYQPSCGAGPDGLDPAQDPELGG